MNRKTRFAIAAATLGTALALAPLAGLAYATTSDGPYVGAVKAGGACTAEQARKKAWGTHDGAKYMCRNTTDEHGRPCTLWKRAVVKGKPTGIWTGGPARCPACTPTASPSTASPTASTTPPTPPSGSTSTTAAPSMTALPILPITGVNVGLVIAAGASFALAGGLLVRVGRRRTPQGARHGHL